jgi:hypothetical protein
MQEFVLSGFSKVEVIIKPGARCDQIGIIPKESRRKVVEGREEFWHNRRGILSIPALAVCLREVALKIDAHGDLEGRAGTLPKLQSAISLALLGQNAHHGPVAPAKDSRKGLFIDLTWKWAISRVRMNPDPRKLLGCSALIDLFVEEFGDRQIVKADRHGCALLANQPNLFHIKQVIRGSQPEGADFGRPSVTQE